MRTMADRIADEKRSYFRLLRYLLSEEVTAGYAELPQEPMPPRIADLLTQIDKRDSEPGAAAVTRRPPRRPS